MNLSSDQALVKYQQEDHQYIEIVNGADSSNTYQALFSQTKAEYSNFIVGKFL